jgi:hypothetical protein
MNCTGPPGKSPGANPGSNAANLAQRMPSGWDCQQRSVLFETPLAKWVRQERINKGYVALVRKVLRKAGA